VLPVAYSQKVGLRKRLLAASLSAGIVTALVGAAPSLATGPAATGVYDPSSPAGDQYSDPFERGRSAGGGGRVTPSGAPGASPLGVGAAGPPTRQASAVPAFGAGVTRRIAAGGRSGGSAARPRAGADRATADRALAAREIGGVDSSSTPDLLLIGGASAALVLGAALLGRLRRRRSAP
jgi:hypothetical protein